MKKKRIHINLIPSDFKNNDYSDIEDCAVARAVKRKFRLSPKNISVCTFGVTLNGNKENELKFKIKDSFLFADFEYVRKEYKKDPQMNKARYFVTLIPA